MASTDTLPYVPANPPVTERTGELSRATWDELYRIAEKLGQNQTPSFKASSPRTQSIPNNASTRITGYTPSSPVPDGWNATTGVFTARQSGWYMVSAWAGTGLNSSSFLKVSVFVNGYDISSSDTIPPAARTYMEGNSSTAIHLSAGGAVDMRVTIVWADGAAHPMTDGAAVFTVTYLHQ